MRSRASLWLLLTAGLAAPAVHAETVYVIDQLVVSVASSQGADAERIGQVKSGDRLELLEREGEEAHVRLPNGTEGWVKASYVTIEEPLAQRLTERTAEIEKLKQEGEKLKQEGERLRQDVNRLQSQLAASRSEAASAAAPASSHTGGNPGAVSAGGNTGGSGPSNSAPAGGSTSPGSEGATASPPEPAHETVFLRQPDRPGQTSWALVVGVAAAMLLVGFVVGWTTLDRRIRQKYGGLRIY
jgi:TolA-binding protein